MLSGSRFTETQRSLLGTGLVTPAPTPVIESPAGPDAGQYRYRDSDFLPNLSARLNFPTSSVSFLGSSYDCAAVVRIVESGALLHRLGKPGNP